MPPSRQTSAVEAARTSRVCVRKLEDPFTLERDYRRDFRASRCFLRDPFGNERAGRQRIGACAPL